VLLILSRIFAYEEWVNAVSWWKASANCSSIIRGIGGLEHSSKQGFMKKHFVSDPVREDNPGWIEPIIRQFKVNVRLSSSAEYYIFPTGKLGAICIDYWLKRR